MSVPSSYPDKGFFTFSNSDLLKFFTTSVQLSANSSFHHLTALIASGSFTNCADRKIISAMNAPVVSKETELKAETIDGRVISITQQTIPIVVFISGRKQIMSFDVIDSPHFPIILGLPWLRENTPIINWTTLTVNLVDQPTPDINVDEVNNTTSPVFATIQEQKTESPYFAQPSHK